MSVERGYRSYIDLVLTVTSTLCTWGVVRNHKLKQYKMINTSMETGLNLCISTNVKNSKTSEFEFYKTWREKRQNKQDIIWQICLQFNIIVNRVVYAFNTKLLILTVVWHEYDGGLCQSWWWCFKMFLCYGLLMPQQEGQLFHIDLTYFLIHSVI